MKVLQRVIIKLFLFAFVVAAAGGITAGVHGYLQSTPKYAIEAYTDKLLANDSDGAYGLLDQSEEDRVLTSDEYALVLAARKYGLASSCEIEEIANYVEGNGDSFVDFQVTFSDESGNVEFAETITVKLQSKQFLGYFDVWKPLSSHCMVRDFELTVPKGAEVYLDNKQVASGWLATDAMLTGRDKYVIPELLPGKLSLVIRHPIFESVNTTLDTADKSADYSNEMPLKQSAKNDCEELGVKALKVLYVSAALNKQKDEEKLLSSCKKDFQKFVKEQNKAFSAEDHSFRNVAVSNYKVQFEEPTMTEDNEVEVEMTLEYKYIIHSDVEKSTGEEDEEGNAITEKTQTSDSGDNKALFHLVYQAEKWQITEMNVPTIKNSK